MKPLKILISGAGVAGPALAYWLSKSGHLVTIVEKAPSLRDGGYAVDFRGKAIEILDKMGILDKVKASQTYTGTVYFVDKQGKHLAPLPSIFLSGELEILRGDLGKILYDLTKDQATYLFNDSITAIDEKPDVVEVSFQNSSSQKFDLVVGADGTHSRVRELVFGDHSQFVRHLGYGVSIFTVDNYLNLEKSGLYYASSDKLVALYSARNNTEAKASFYFVIPKNTERPSGVASQMRLVRDTFDGESWETTKLLKKMETSKDFYFDTIDQVRMKTWHKSHVVLLGDAAYSACPLSGAGTGLAVIGAHILAKEINGSGGNYTAAFSNYQRSMSSYVKKAQLLPKALGPLMIPKYRILLSLRIMLLRVIRFLGIEKVITKLARSPSSGVDISG